MPAKAYHPFARSLMTFSASSCVVIGANNHADRSLSFITCAPPFGGSNLNHSFLKPQVRIRRRPRKIDLQMFGFETGFWTKTKRVAPHGTRAEHSATCLPLAEREH